MENRYSKVPLFCSIVRYHTNENTFIFSSHRVQLTFVHSPNKTENQYTDYTLENPMLISVTDYNKLAEMPQKNSLFQVFKQIKQIFYILPLYIKKIAKVM
jgi:hypothetical protein